MLSAYISPNSVDHSSIVFNFQGLKALKFDYGIDEEHEQSCVGLCSVPERV